MVGRPGRRRGSVLAVDRNLSLCRHLAKRTNVGLIEAELETLELEPATYDLVHTRNVLMHLEDGRQDHRGDRRRTAARRAAPPRRGRLLRAWGNDLRPLRPRRVTPGGEVDLGAGRCRSPFPGFRSVDLGVTVDASMLHGASDEAAFWAHTIMSARDRITDLNGASGAPTRLGGRDRPASRCCWPIRPSGPRLPR